MAVVVRGAHADLSRVDVRDELGAGGSTDSIQFLHNGRIEVAVSCPQNPRSADDTDSVQILQ
jgi:hypothetical protein